MTFLVEGEAGEVLIAFRGGPAVWSQHPFGTEVRKIDGTQARVVPLGVLREGKSLSRLDAEQAAVDRVDYRLLSRLPFR